MFLDPYKYTVQYIERERGSTVTVMNKHSESITTLANIIRVLATSRGVVMAAAIPPAIAPQIAP